jgi:quercetin dioxygenase-like cupin family protein
MQRSFVEKSESGWNGVEREGYVPGETTAVVRHTLIGHKKEFETDPGPSSEVRYFDVPPGAVTRLEKHEHEHFVIVGEGVGYAIVGDDVREIRQHDVVYVAPWEPHQFINRSDAHFGFFCMVPACRDIPQLLSADELAHLKATPAGAYADPDGAPPPRIRESLAAR